MKHFINYFAIIAIFCTVNSCKPDPITPVLPSAPAKANWTLHPATIGKQFITSGLYKEANRLTVVGFDYRLYLDTAHQVIQHTPFHRTRSEITYILPAIHKKFFAYVYEGIYTLSQYTSVKVHSTANPAIYSNIPIQQFGRYVSIIQNEEPTCVLTDANKLWIPVMDSTGGMKGYILKFHLTIGTDSIEYRLEERLQLPNSMGQRLWDRGAMQAFGEDTIWASLMGTCYQINLRTNVITPVFPLNNGKFMYIRDTLFAFGLDETLQNISYNYLPKGQTQWQRFKIGGISGSEMRWFFLENEILAVLDRNQLYHFKVDGNQVHFKPLDLQGTELIQDITYFNGRVYIASLQGLYYKSWKDFWTYL